MLFTLSLPLLKSAFDLITVTFISVLIILSVLSLTFIFHLHFKSKILKHLQGFNSLWTVRFLLVLFIFLWAITELLRLPFFRRKYLNIFFPSLTISHQVNLCKVHIILSLGFFEPAFLITLIFLLNASVKMKTPNDRWAITFVILTCLPIVTLQAMLIFFDPFKNQVPWLFHQTTVVFWDDYGTETILCAYPFLNCAVFAGFGCVYSTWFLFSCWRVLSLAINKGLRVRIYVLASAVLIALPLQVISLGFTALWSLHEEVYNIVSLMVFLGAFCCAAIGEGILVIKPISDALDAGGFCCPRDVGCRHKTLLLKNREGEDLLVKNRVTREGEGCV
ncbi:hypothetical protein VNO77_04822 [Canavalia gladiata]|uniref:Uncharacterized protein n=1 Tax=Canavalia gladiata TaxID=3824 RepID=A0AAN9R843_CANGL